MIYSSSKRVTVTTSQVIVLALLLIAGLAAANPSGPTIVSGQATFSTQGNVLTVTNTPGTIINWQRFGLNSLEVTQFVQQSSSSTVLNRVIGRESSPINGTLASNGQVFLINPNGVVFGPTAQVNLPSLTVSTGQISDGAFLAGATTPVDGGTAIITPLNIGMFAGQYVPELAGIAFSPPPSPGSQGNTTVNPGMTDIRLSPPPSVGSSGSSGAGAISVGGNASSGTAGVSVSANFSATQVEVPITAVSVGVVPIGSNVPIFSGPGTTSVFIGAGTPNAVNPSGAAGLSYNANAVTGTVSFANAVTGSSAVGVAPNTAVTITTSSNPSGIGSLGNPIAATGATSSTIVGSAANSGGTIASFAGPPSVGSSGGSVATTKNSAVDDSAGTSNRTATVGLGNTPPAGGASVTAATTFMALEKREPLY